MLMITVMAGDDGVSGVAEDGCDGYVIVLMVMMIMAMM